jgi:hypothetical protein
VGNDKCPRLFIIDDNSSRLENYVNECKKDNSINYVIATQRSTIWLIRKLHNDRERTLR